MDKKVTRQRIERFLSGQSEGKEAEIIAAYLQQLSPEELAGYLPDEEWQELNLNDSLQDRVMEQMWDHITAGTEKSAKKNRIRRFFVMTAAAACLVLAARLGYQYVGGGADKISKATALPAATVSTVFTMIRNVKPRPLDTTLPDGSRVRLLQGTEIAYTGDFNLNRQLELNGDARFSVVHDSKRPFMIRTKGIITEDIGTSFWVLSPKNASTITVKLLEGSVSVASQDQGFVMVPKLLKPGQQLLIDKAAGTALVSSFSSKKRVPKTPENSRDLIAVSDAAGGVEWSNQSMRFSKTTLASTFRQLEKTYKVTIDADSADIQDLQFTGTVYYSDSIETILEAICSMNDLSYQKNGDHIIIKN